MKEMSFIEMALISPDIILPFDLNAKRNNNIIRQASSAKLLEATIGVFLLLCFPSTTVYDMSIVVSR